MPAFQNYIHTTKSIMLVLIKMDRNSTSEHSHLTLYLGVSGLVDCVAPKRFLPTLWRILFSPTIPTAADCIAKLLPDISIELCLDEGTEDPISMLMFCGVKFCEGSRFSEETESLFRLWFSDGLVVSMVMVEDPTVMCSLFEMEDVIFGQDDDLK